MSFSIIANLRLHQTDLNWHFFLSLKMTEKLSFSSRSQIKVTLEILGQSLKQAGIPDCTWAMSWCSWTKLAASSLSHNHSFLEHFIPLHVLY